MKEGQCSRRKGPGKGRSPAAARAPLSGPGQGDDNDKGGRQPTRHSTLLKYSKQVCTANRPLLVKSASWHETRATNKASLASSLNHKNIL